MKKLLFIFLLTGFAKIMASNHEVTSSKELFSSIEKASDGDSIIIHKGHYKVRNLIIDKRLTIVGIDYPVLDANFKEEIFIVKSPGVTITGIKFINVGETSMIDWAAIKVLETSDINILKNKFENCYFGIYLSASSKIFVTGNQIKGNPKEEQTTGNGIHAWKCDSIHINKNYIEGHRDGIYFEFVTNSLIEDNFSTKNIRYGLHFMFSHKDVYQRNTFTQNGAGVAVMYSKYVKMLDNIFTKNWGGSAYGILLKDITDSEIRHNYFFSNTIGVYMEGCSRLKIENCLFEENGYGIRIMANCDENYIGLSNFISNTFDLATNGSVVLNTLEKNYWDKYQGYDLDKNGIGDISFRPVSMFSTLVERMPQVMILLRSFTSTLLDKIEKIFPSFTPENLKDDSPFMKPNQFKNFIITA